MDEPSSHTEQAGQARTEANPERHTPCPSLNGALWSASLLRSSWRRARPTLSRRYTSSPAGQRAAAVLRGAEP